MSGERCGGPKRASDRANTSRRRPSLETLEGRQLLATFAVTNTQDRFPNGTTVPNSLRDAIEKANNTGGVDTIAFAIPGTGVHTITPGSALPAITDQALIDGTSQPGYSASPVIELDGSQAGIGANGLRLSSSLVTVTGLAINRFQGSGIRIEASRDTIQKCSIGTSTAGTTAFPNGNSGIYIDSGSNNQIGGYDGNLGSLGNVISGNTGDGITIVGSGGSNNVIQGNYIGTNSTGLTALGNSGSGISIDTGAFNQIGGSFTGQTNVISGNAANGIEVRGNSTFIVRNYIGTDGNPVGGVAGGGNPSGGNIAVPNGGAGILVASADSTTIGQANFGNTVSGNAGAGIQLLTANRTTIQGNVVGTDSGLSKNLGNQGPGILIDGSQNTIGGAVDASDGTSNTVAFNGQPTGAGGVSIASGRRNSILGNSIRDNFGLGIILKSENGQPVPNDPGDPDTGPNDLQNYPVLATAATASGRTLIQGTLNSRPSTTYTIQFFTNVAADSSGAGEGRSLLGSTLITTDVNGDAVIDLTLSRPSVVGQFLSATATDAQGNTSEFAVDVPITVANQADLSVDILPTQTATVNGDLVYTIRVTNNSGDTPATNVRFTQTLPTSVAFQSASPSSLAIVGNQVVGSLGTIPPSTTVIVTVTVTPMQTGTISTTATVSSSEIDPNTSDNTDTEVTNVNIPVNLGVTLQSNPSTAIIGQQFTIVALVKNSPRPGIDTGSATNTQLVITLPANVTFVQASSGQGSTTFGGGRVMASLGTIAKGNVIAVQVVVMAPFDVPASGDLTFTADVSSSEIEPGGVDPNPNTATISVPVVPTSDLGLTFTATPNPVVTGSTVTYTYSIFNNGPSTATNVRFTDPLPAGVALVALPPPSQGNASSMDVGGVPTIVVDFGDLAAGATASGVIVVQVTSTASGTLDNPASVTLNEVDQNPANNAANAPLFVNPADLAVLVSASPDPIAQGGNLTYTIIVGNNGPATATGVILTDILPGGVNFVSADPSQGSVALANGVLTAALGAIPAGGSATVTLVVQAPASTTLANVVAVDADQDDINPGNNTSVTATSVNPADLGVQLTSSAVSALAGDPIVFTAVVTNNGPFAATGVQLVDTLPSGLSLASSAASQGIVGASGSLVIAQIGTLQPGASATITLVVVAQAEGTYANTVTVGADQVDPSLLNNSSQVSVAATNAAGVFHFASATFNAAEGTGQAIVTVTRTSGNLGGVSVNYATSNGSAVAGVNYTPVSGTLVFLSGETSKSFAVPLLADGQVRGNLTFNLVLGSPMGGASLGTNSTASVVIADADRDLVGPSVVDVINQGGGRKLFGVTLVFDEALDPTRAVDLGNYSLFAPNRNGRGEHMVPLDRPVYDDATHTVTLTAASRLDRNTFYRVIVNGSNASGVTDLSGNFVRGDSSGTNGRNFVTSFARGSALRYADGDGDLVRLNLSRGGILDLSRDASGEGSVLRVTAVGGKTNVLTGHVRRRGRGSDGVTSFRAIDGAGFGGRVNSRLTTPKFFADDVTRFIRAASAGSRVRSASLSLFGGRKLGKF